MLSLRESVRLAFRTVEGSNVGFLFVRHTPVEGRLAVSLLPPNCLASDLIADLTGSALNPPPIAAPEIPTKDDPPQV